MDCSTPGFPVHRQFLELAHTHVHRVGDAIQHQNLRDEAKAVLRGKFIALKCMC